MNCQFIIAETDPYSFLMFAYSYLRLHSLKNNATYVPLAYNLCKSGYIVLPSTANIISRL